MPAHKQDPEKRFWEKVEKTDECWIYTASGNIWGYGQYWYENGWTSAHRFSYFLKVGYFPEGKDVHHICRVRRCVRPDHLVEIEKGKHQRLWKDLSNSIEATKKRFASRTKCSSGHDLTEQNTRIYTNKHGYTERRCRTCHREGEARRRKESGG